MARTARNSAKKSDELDFNVREATRQEAGFGGAYSVTRRRAASNRTFSTGSGQPPRTFRLRPPRRSPVGSSPGELFSLEDDVATTIEVVAWDESRVIHYEAQHPKEALDSLASWKYVWVNLKGNADRATLGALRDVFELHPLAVEDAWNVPQRPKFDVYANHLYLVLDCMSLRQGMDPEDGASMGEGDAHHLDVEQISIFLGNRFVLTIQEKPSDLFAPIRRRFLTSEGRMKLRSVDYVAYSMVDTIVDTWFPAVDFLAEKVEEMEDDILLRRQRGVVQRLLAFRQRLHEIRRMVHPMHDAVAAFYLSESALVQKGTKVFLRDCLDHASRLLEMAETTKEHAVSLLDVHIALASHEMNEVMKILTLISTIFIPLSFIAGVYGMNFNPEISRWNMPELDWVYGYPFALMLMTAVAVGFGLYFHRRRWL